MHVDRFAQIMAAEERLRQAMLRVDIPVLDELIAPDLLFTNHFGQIVSKEEDLTVQQSGILHLDKLAPSQQKIRLHSEFAVVSVQMHLTGSYQDQTIDMGIRYTRVWEFFPDGSVRIVAGHASTVQAG